jgi:cytochrome c oxidase cbb3-type subunit 3
MNTLLLPETEEPQDVVMGHADDNDGIEEYDNQLPGWWVWLFYLTIAVGLFLFLDWHVVSPRSLAREYDQLAAAAAARYPSLVPAPVVMEPEAIAQGEALYTTHCVACHAAGGTGGVGPDLTDALWVHGGSPDEINHTIFFGVDGKGMPGWGTILGAEETASVAAYVHSLGGRP